MRCMNGVGVRQLLSELKNAETLRGLSDSHIQWSGNGYLRNSQRADLGIYWFAIEQRPMTSSNTNLLQV
jgi:hypothetical protein